MPMPDLRERLAPLIGRGEGQTAQAELARRTGIAQSNISAWLSGARPLLLEHQITLARALGLRVKLTVTPTAHPHRRQSSTPTAP